MEINAKQLWSDGGYDKHNDYYVSMTRIKKHAKSKGISEDLASILLVEFFLELEKEPFKFRTENDICFCGCEIDKSGTNAIHTMFKRIDIEGKKEQDKIDKIINDDFNKRLNKVIKQRKTPFRSKCLKFIGFGGFTWH